MISDKGDAMGRFSIEVELANNDDLADVRRGRLPIEQTRYVRIRGPLSAYRRSRNAHPRRSQEGVNPERSLACAPTRS